MLAARSKVVAGRRMTGFNDSVSYPELVVQRDAEAAGATWVQDANRQTPPSERCARPEPLTLVFSMQICAFLRGGQRL